MKWIATIASLFITFAIYAQTSAQPQLSPELQFKIGQMMIVGFGGLKEVNGKIVWQDTNGTRFNEHSLIAQNIKNYGVGGIILFERPFYSAATGQYLKDRNIQHPSQVRSLIDDLQAFAKQVAQQQHRPSLPLIVSADQEGGMVDRLPYYRGFILRFPIPQAFGTNQQLAGNDPVKKSAALNSTYNIVSKMAEELANLHFNVDFAPSVDLNVNPLNPIIGAMGRSLSADPQIVVDQTNMIIKAMHNKGIIVTIKHFPGHGSSQQDSHENLVNVTDTYQLSELLPYRQLINYGYDDIIMTTHVINGNIDKTQCKPGAKNDATTWCPATLSYNTLTKLLRQKLGFKGVIISDDMMMGAIAKQYSLEDALAKGINAGVDMFIISNNDGDHTAAFVNTIAKLIQEGKVSEKQIDQAYQRIIRLKNKIQLPSVQAAKVSN